MSTTLLSQRVTPEVRVQLVAELQTLASRLAPFAVFGGHKQSGLGAENGLEGVLEYTNPQTISIHKAGHQVTPSDDAVPA